MSFAGLDSWGYSSMNKATIYVDPCVANQWQSCSALVSGQCSECNVQSGVQGGTLKTSSSPFDIDSIAPIWGRVLGGTLRTSTSQFDNEFVAPVWDRVLGDHINSCILIEPFMLPESSLNIIVVPIYGDTVLQVTHSKADLTASLLQMKMITEVTIALIQLVLLQNMMYKHDYVVALSKVETILYNKNMHTKQNHKFHFVEPACFAGGEGSQNNMHNGSKPKRATRVWTYNDISDYIIHGEPNPSDNYKYLTYTMSDTINKHDKVVATNLPIEKLMKHASKKHFVILP